MHTRTLSVILMMTAAFACAQTPAEPLVGKAHDGGILIYDGICYHYADPERFKGMTLWLPPEIRMVRGVILNGNPGSTGDTRTSAIRRAWQHVAASLDFGYCGVTCFPGRQVYPAGGETMLKVLSDWAGMGLHPELANVPLFPRGNSNGGMTAYALTCYAPERVIAYTNNVGPSFNPERPPAAALRVPGLHHPGPVDPLLRMGYKATAEMFWDISPKGALWAWDAEEGKGHQIGSSTDIDLPFMQTIVDMRLAPDADCRKGPVELTPLKRSEGFLADTSTWYRFRRPDGTRAPTYVAPAGEFTGDADHASWLPDADIAALYQAVATYAQPITLELDQARDAQDPDGVVLIQDKEMRTFTKGQTITLRCEVEDRFEWKEIRFYEGARQIGGRRNGQEPRLDVKLEKGKLIRSYLARAFDAEGNECISKPMHVLVIDPAVDARIQDQMDRYDAPVKTGKVAAGADIDDQPEVQAGPDALVAYALSAKQEGAFAAHEARASGFWDAPGLKSSAATLTVKRHAGKADRDASDAPVLSVRAAYSRTGLYLLFVLEDDRQEGGMDFHLSREAEITPDDLITWERTWKLDSCQYHMAFGGDRLIRNIPTPLMIRSTDISLAQAEKRYGIVVRHVRHEGKRCQEWLLPWSYVGKPSALTQPRAGRALGLELGFNGKGDAAKLRWPRGLDVWAVRLREDRPTPWGSLILGPPTR